MKKILIKKARLETGFEFKGDFVMKTKTELYDVLIQDGKVIQIEETINTDSDEVINAEGKLLMPSLREMHIHTDKTYFGGPWRATRKNPKGIFSRIEEEETLLPKQLPVALERAGKIIELLISQGHTHIRSHCNVDPHIGTKHVELTMEALHKYKNQITFDVVAFPQHGLLRSKVEPLMREAMKMGATLVGGLDPATVDRNIEKSLYTSMDIAVQSNTGLDLHLHESDTLGAFVFYKLAELTKEASKTGKVTISHALALGDLEEDALEDVIAALVEAGIDITTTVPISRDTIPIPRLSSRGVQVSLGHDSLTDHWSPFGTGNTIEKLCVLAERFRFVDEFSLNRAWKYATGGITPLNDMGIQIWPKIGDKANMILLDAVCSAQAIARRKKITHVLFEGNITHQQSENIY